MNKKCFRNYVEIHPGWNKCSGLLAEGAAVLIPSPGQGGSFRHMGRNSNLGNQQMLQCKRSLSLRGPGSQTFPCAQPSRSGPEQLWTKADRKLRSSQQSLENSPRLPTLPQATFAPSIHPGKVTRDGRQLQLPSMSLQ